MNITLKQLRSFVTITKLQRMNKAADALCLTQPALSKQIKLLNEQCKEAVFLHQGKRLWLSPFGRSLLPYAEAVLAAEAKLNKHIQQTSQMHLSLLIMPAMADRLLYAYAELKTNYPHICLTYETITEALIYEAVEKRVFDLVISKNPLKNSIYHSEKLFSFRYHLCANPNFSGMTLKRKKLSFKSPPTLISKEKNNQLVNSLQQELNTDLASMQIKNDQSIKKACLLNLGIAFLPDYLIHEELQQGALITLPCQQMKSTEALYISYLNCVNKNKEITELIKLLSVQTY